MTVAYSAQAVSDGATSPLNLTTKASRVLAENAALVAATLAGDRELLNL